MQAGWMGVRTEGCNMFRASLYTPEIHRHTNLLPPKRNFTHASTLTYTTATTNIKIVTVKNQGTLPTRITRQKISHPVHTTNTKTYTNATSYIFTEPDGLCGNQRYGRELLMMGKWCPKHVVSNINIIK